MAQNDGKIVRFKRSLAGKSKIDESHPGFRGVVDLHRLKTAIQFGPERVTALVAGFEIYRLPWVWGWFHRGGLPLSSPDRWFESLIYSYPDESDANEEDYKLSWCKTYRNDLASFASCDEPAVVIQMLERLIQFAVSVLEQLCPRTSFCDRYHDVLQLRINCERLSAPFGEAPNIWNEAGGLPPIPDDHWRDSIAELARLIDYAFANAFDAVLFQEIEDYDFWETPLGLSGFLKHDKSTGLFLPFDGTANDEIDAIGKDNFEGWVEAWYAVLAESEGWFVELLSEAKGYAIICGEIPQKWEDTLCDGPSEASERGDGWKTDPPLHSNNVLSWTEFGSSIRPFFTLPQKPLDSLNDLAFWLSACKEKLHHGNESFMPWLGEPPSVELAKELAARTLRNANRWLVAQQIPLQLPDWPGKRSPIPVDEFQQELTIAELHNWCIQQSQHQTSNKPELPPEQVSLSENEYKESFGESLVREAIPKQSKKEQISVSNDAPKDVEWTSWTITKVAKKWFPNICSTSGWTQFANKQRTLKKIENHPVSGAKTIRIHISVFKELGLRFPPEIV